MSNSTKAIYFPGLNGLRFMAAFCVIIVHIEHYKQAYGYSILTSTQSYQHLGANAVTFFFVLSGFLITYLLLDEQANQGRISLKQFYLKRVLRIWPLYYLILIIGLYIVPQFDALNVPHFSDNIMRHYKAIAILDFAILPNLVFAFYDETAYLVHIWSIGVEEQFYLIWPLLLMTTRNYLKLFVGFILFYLLVKVGLFAAGLYYGHLSWVHHVRDWVYLTRIDCMAIGGVGAYWLFTDKKIIRAILHPYTQAIALTALALLLLAEVKVPIFNHEVYAILFLLLILPVATNRNKYLVRLLENKPLNFLGTISYGLYMYHVVIIGIVMLICRRFIGNELHLPGNLLLYTLTIALTILVAAVSYYQIEIKIIRLRSQISTVLTEGNLQVMVNKIALTLRLKV